MKKFNKIVSLVMAVSMLAGLFIFAGPAAGAAPTVDLAPVRYNDHDSITPAYDPAIQIFSKMNVIEGRGGNNFEPLGDLTRAEAATIITRTLASREAADQLDSHYSAFNDVPAGEWMTGPTAFVRNRNIMAGIGNNNFNPHGTLTKVQWLRILLSAIGYGQNGEFEGDGWAIRVYETASNRDVDLFRVHNRALAPPFWTGIRVPEAGLNEPINREETMALLNNAVRIVGKVSYDRAADSYRLVNITTPDAGLGGSSNWALIAGDIGLIGTDIPMRDRYGRPHDWYRRWDYRGVQIYQEPITTPEKIADYNGNHTGTQLRTALQGVATVDALSLERLAYLPTAGSAQC